jgi:hypothetical protein
MLILLFWIVDALFWRAFVPQDPQALNPLATLQGPSPDHWFGTDNLGRDVFSRVLAGAASVLTVAPLATLLGVSGGIAVGLVTGYYRGLVDDVVSRVVDAMLAFPLIIIAILVLAVLGRSVVNVVVVIGIVFIPIVTRTVRSAVLSEREHEYVAAEADPTALDDRVGREVAHERHRHCRLAAPRLADEAICLARIDVERHVRQDAQRPGAATVADREPVDVDSTHGGRDLAHSSTTC